MLRPLFTKDLLLRAALWLTAIAAFCVTCSIWADRWISWADERTRNWSQSHNVSEFDTTQETERDRSQVSELRWCCEAAAMANVELLPDSLGVGLRYTVWPLFPDSVVGLLHRGLAQLRLDDSSRVSADIEGIFWDLGFVLPNRRFDSFLAPVMINAGIVSVDPPILQDSAGRRRIRAISESSKEWTLNASDSTIGVRITVDGHHAGIRGGNVTVYALPHQVLPLTDSPVNIGPDKTIFSFPTEDSLEFALQITLKEARALGWLSWDERWEREEQEDAKEQMVDGRIPEESALDKWIDVAMRDHRVASGIALPITFALLVSFLVLPFAAAVPLLLRPPRGFYPNHSTRLARSAALVGGYLLSWFPLAIFLGVGLVTEFQGSWTQWSFSIGALPFFVWPFLVFSEELRRGERQMGRRWRIWMRAVLGASWLTSFVLGTYVDFDPMLSFVCMTMALVLFGGWMGLELCGRATGITLGVLTAAASCAPLFVIVLQTFEGPTKGHWFIRHVIPVILVLPLAIAAFRVVAPWITWCWSKWTERPASSQASRWLTAAAFIVCALATPQGAIPLVVDALRAAFTLWEFVLAAILCLLIRARTTTNTNLQSAMAPSIVLAFMGVTELAWPGNVGGLLSYVPLALFAFRYCALGPELGSALWPANPKEVRETVRRRILIHECRAAYRALRNRLRKGDLAYEVYRSEARALEEELTKLEEDRRRNPDPLAFGPAVPPWERGITGLRYGAVVGVGWSLLHAARNVMHPDQPGAVGTLEEFADTAFPFLVFGFLFGVFFPRIRGGDGLRKSLVCFLAVTAPGVITSVLIGGAWSERGAETLLLTLLPLLAHFLFLGLAAGDYQTLRHGGLRARHLVDAHALGVVIGWGAALVLASTAAVVSAIHAGAGEAIGGVLGTIVPQLVEGLNGK
jgi:hypothetical protein